MRPSKSYFRKVALRLASIVPPSASLDSALSAINAAVGDVGTLDQIVTLSDLKEWLETTHGLAESASEEEIELSAQIVHIAFALRRQTDRLLSGRGDDVAVYLRADSWWALADAFRRADEMVRAADCYSRASDEYAQVGDEGSAVQCRMRGAACLQELYRIDEAHEAYQEVEPILQRLNDLVDLAICRSNRAVCLQSLGRSYDALPLLLDAVEVLRDQGNPNHFARTMVNYANCLAELGRVREALPVYVGIEALVRQHCTPIQHARYQMNRANCLAQMGRSEESLSFYEAAADILQTRGRLIDYARCRVNQIGCLTTLGRPEEALQLCEITEELLQDAGLEVYYARCRMNHANCLSELGQLHEAADLYVEVIHACNQIGRPADAVSWLAHYNLAILLMDRPGGLRYAAEVVRSALDIVERVAGSATRLEDRVGLRESYANVYRLAVIIDLRQDEHLEAFRHAQQAKERALLDLVSTGTAQNPLEEELQRLAGEELEIVGRLSQSREEPDARLVEALQSIYEQRKAAVEQLSASRPERALLTVGLVQDLSDIQSMLQTTEVLLDALDLGDRLALFVVTHEGLRASYTVESNRLGQALGLLDTQWTESVDLARRGVPQEVEALADLYDLLILPATPYLEAATALIISPSGRLHGVPFAALWHPTHEGDLRYLIQDHSLCTIPMATSLWLLRNERTGPSPLPSLLAAAPFACPEIPRDPRRLAAASQLGTQTHIRAGREPLPYSGWEIEELGRILSGQYPLAERQVLHGADATLQAVRQWLPGMVLVVLATHGTIDAPEAGLQDFRLVFSARDGEESDLVMREIFAGELPLHRALSIALTACWLGQVALHGEEAMGFQQAFLSAGVRVALAPLWAVEDPAMAVLSVEYHRSLMEEGATVSQAMKVAMQRVRNTPGWEHPFFWAAMLPSGDGSLSLSACSCAT